MSENKIARISLAAATAVLAALSLLAVGASAQQLSVKGPSVSPNGCIDYLCTTSDDCSGIGLCNACDLKDGRCGIIK